MIEVIMDFSKIIIADLILSGDNALVIGMAAAGLSPELRRKAIIYGMVIAAALRIVFAVVATSLLTIPGILFIGALLLFWVGVCQRSCPPDSCGVSDFRSADSAFWVEPDWPGRLPVAGFTCPAFRIL